MATPAQKKADLLHPLTSLDWTSTKHGDVSVIDTLHAVWLNEKLYFRGTSYAGSSIILCCDSDMQLLTTIKSPTLWSALTTYQGRLVLVGGLEISTGHPTNKLWSLQDDDSWVKNLPPMLTQRYCATAVSSACTDSPCMHLLVAGGKGDSAVTNAVEVFDGKKWSTTEPLPKGVYDMKSAHLNGEWYLMGGWTQGHSVFSASVDALLAIAVTHKGEGTHTVWRTLPEAPLHLSSPATFGSLFLAIGGLGGSPSDAIHAFIPDTLSWLHVADLPEPMQSASSLVLPSGDLVVVQEKSSESMSMFKTSLKGLIGERDTALAERVVAVSKRDALRAQLAEMPISTAAMDYLRGVDVVAETSFEVTSQAHTYEWRGYGVKLHVQQDSLPADCPQCRVEMRASLSGQYALPANCELVSGVYWVCNCPVKLFKHATLEVQHCSTRREGLSFVRAECTQEQLPYKFQRLEGGVFSEHSSHGSIELTRFSGWAIVNWIWPDVAPQYSAEVYYVNDMLNTWKVLFTIRRRKSLSLEDKIFRSRLEEFTGQRISRTGPLFLVNFIADRIELEIPDSLTGWSITCLSSPAIFRSIVDGFRARPGDFIPHCQISVSGTAAGVGEVLSVRLNLAGAKEPCNYFTLQCGPTSADPGSAPQPQPVRPSEPARPAANHRPSVQQQQSPELMVFQDKRLILHTGILNNIQDIARRAFARSLIPGGVRRSITDTLNHSTADERTDQLLNELESRVKNDPAVLMQFVDVLRESDAACYSTIITTITEALDTPPAEQQH